MNPPSTPDTTTTDGDRRLWPAATVPLAAGDVCRGEAGRPVPAAYGAAWVPAEDPLGWDARCWTQLR